MEINTDSLSHAAAHADHLKRQAASQNSVDHRVLDRIGDEIMQPGNNRLRRAEQKTVLAMAGLDRAKHWMNAGYVPVPKSPAV